jgi:hypothetical protein
MAGPVRDIIGELTAALKAGIYGGEAATEFLETLKPAEARALLLEIIHSSDDEQAVAQAATEFTGLGDPRAFEVLVSLLDRPSSLIQARALYALQELQDPRTNNVLATYIRGERGLQRSIAVGVLGSFPGDVSVQALRESLQDPDRYVCMAAIRSLGGFALPEIFGDLAFFVEGENYPSRIDFEIPQIKDAAWAALERFHGTTAEPKLLALKARERDRIVSAFQSREGSPRWSEVFRRSTVAGDAFFSAAKIEPDLVVYCKRLGVPHQSRAQMYSPGYEGWAFLDGGVTKIHPYGMGSPWGTRVWGTQTLRYLVGLFGLQPPQRRLRGEAAIHSAQELETEMKEARDMTPARAQEALDALFVKAFGSALDD